jgi:hypothetical protein
LPRASPSSLPRGSPAISENRHTHSMVGRLDNSLAHCCYVACCYVDSRSSAELDFETNLKKHF